MKLINLRGLQELIRGTTRAQLYRWARHGLIPTVRIGRRVFVEEAALAAFIARGGKALPGGWRKAPVTEPVQNGKARIRRGRASRLQKRATNGQGE